MQTHVNKMYAYKHVPVSQEVPVNPSAHSQANPSPTSVHVAPLKHGSLSHGSNTESIAPNLHYFGKCQRIKIC